MRKFNLLGSNSLVIGDRITDISAAHAAGISRKILLYDEKSLEVNGSYLGKSQIGSFLPFELCSNLSQAAEVINGWYQND
jgi:histidinol phosphatase-like enzyme